MAGRAAYDDADKAKVYVALVTHEWNIKRTSRESGYPESTVRRWSKEFKEDGPPDIDDVQEAAGDFIEDAERVRGKALALLEAKVERGEGKIAELSTLMGILDDKIARARGLATGRVEHKLSLPSPEEIRDALVEGHRQALAVTRQREAEIIDAEFVEQAPAALPPAR